LGKVQANVAQLLLPVDFFLKKLLLKVGM